MNAARGAFGGTHLVIVLVWRGSSCRGCSARPSERTVSAPTAQGPRASRGATLPSDSTWYSRGLWAPVIRTGAELPNFPQHAWPWAGSWLQTAAASCPDQEAGLRHVAARSVTDSQSQPSRRCTLVSARAGGSCQGTRPAPHALEHFPEWSLCVPAACEAGAPAFQFGGAGKGLHPGARPVQGLVSGWSGLGPATLPSSEFTRPCRRPPRPAALVPRTGSVYVPECTCLGRGPERPCV